MKEVIERMLKVEEEARAALAEAEKKAADISEKSRRETAERCDKMRQDARAEAARRLEASRAALKKTRAERLAGETVGFEPWAQAA